MSTPILAVSDSPLARSLFHEKKLTTQLETGGPLTTSAVTEVPGAQWLLHNSVWNWSLAHPEALAQQDVLTVTQAALERTHAPWLSVHLGFSATQVVFSEGMRPASAVLGRSTLSTLLTSTVNTLKGTLGVPLLLENLDYNATGAYEHICEPNFIRTVLEATDTYFLLDLSHAQVSASRLGFALDDYLAQLPLERVRQLHISGPRLVGETFADVHKTLRPVDYQLLEQMLEQTSPWAVTLEYRRDAEALLKQVERLKDLLEQAAR